MLFGLINDPVSSLYLVGNIVYNVFTLCNIHVEFHPCCIHFKGGKNWPIFIYNSKCYNIISYQADMSTKHVNAYHSKHISGINNVRHVLFGEISEIFKRFCFLFT